MPESPRPRRRNLAKPTRSWTLAEMEYNVVRPKPQALFRILVAVSITAIFLVILRRSPSISYSDPLFKQESGSLHVLVTGGAGYIGSHAALRLLEDGNRVTIVDNLSRGNLGAVEVLKQLFPESGRLHFVLADLGDSKAINAVFDKNKFDVVLHFAAVAYVGESVAEPLRYYHNITTNTLLLLEAMDAHDVSKLIYSSTCATYGEPAIMPITEKTLQVPINPYGKAKKMSEDIIKDYARNGKLAATILRYFNVIGSDPEGRLGEAPRPELRQHGRITGACFDAAMGLIGGLTIKGQDYETKDGTCIRDYIHVTDLVDAHVKAMATVSTREVQVYNVGTGKGSSVREFVEACKKATGVNVTVFYEARRPGDYAEVYSNPSKIREELHWAAEYTDLAESLSMAWKWRKQNPNGYKDPKALMLQYALREILNPKLDGMTVVGEANLVKSA